MAAPFEFAGEHVAPGTRKDFELPVARLATQNLVHLPVAVLHGRKEGPRLFVTAGIHGDELNGTEIARALLQKIDVTKLAGTLLVLPVVNVVGFIHGSRYLPDRRDLNRQFPGSTKGSLASQLANLVMREVVARCTHGIDLHGGTHHRTNLPQARGDMGNTASRTLCEAFGAPIALHAKHRSGSLRWAASREGIPVVVYEGGEPHRFEERAIAVGLNGTLRVMRHLGMRKTAPKRRQPQLVSLKSSWMRASVSGIARLRVTAGDRVEKKQVLAEIGNALGQRQSIERASKAGVVIGHTLNPIVSRGDAMVHIATV